MNPTFVYRHDHRGRSAESDAPTYLRELIEAVLFTAPGERVMRPTFGSGALQLVFAPNSPELAGATQMLLQGALTQHLSEWIQVRDVQVQANEGVLNVLVAYSERGSDRVEVASFTPGVAP